MLRAVYILLLRLHPRFFRKQFAEEMLWIFDRTPSPARAWLFIADALQSLGTQWILRSWMFRSESEETPKFAVDRVPAFYTCGPDIPPPVALLNGAFGSVIVFALACFALAHGGNRPQVSTYYSDDFRTGRTGSGDARVRSGLPVPPAPGAESVASAAWDTVVSWLRQSVLPPPPPPPVQPRLKPAEPSTGEGGTILPSTPKPIDSAVYFSRIPVLAALDTDHDGVLSAEEIAHAPAALALLDTDHDGKLTAEECGFKPPEIKTQTRMKNPVFERARLLSLQRGRIVFVRLEPVLTALDANRDTVLDAAEIKNAPAALQSLDRNHDGRLTIDEVARDPAVVEANAILLLDTNLDRRISPRERIGFVARRYKEVLDAADTNHDGYITEEELIREIRRRADLDHDGVVTWQELSEARRQGKLADPNITRLPKPLELR